MTPLSRLVVIGGSAGSIEPLLALVRSLPRGFPVPIAVVVHLSPTRPSLLAKLLGRADGAISVEAMDGMALEPGHIYTARPNFHLLVEDGHLRLERGPRRNRSRPAIDPLFQSAAAAYGPRTIAILLSGALYDGTAGLAAVKQAGGVTIAQSPEEAMFPAMVESAMEHMEVDHVLPIDSISSLLQKLAAEPVPEYVPSGGSPEGHQGQQKEAANMEMTEQFDYLQKDPPSAFTCPDCGGSLWERATGDAQEYICRVGHGFAAEALFDAKQEAVEEGLWIALRTLEERLDLACRMAVRAESRGLDSVARSYRERERETRASYTILKQFMDGDHKSADPLSAG